MQSPLLAFDLQLNGRSPSGDADFSPRLCVGFLFLILYPALPGPAASHNFVTYSLSHTTLSHAIFHTQLCHTHFHTHTTLSHTLFHTQLCHTQLCRTPSFTHNFVTHSLSHNFVTHNFVAHHLSHTTLSHTLFHTQLCHTHGTWRDPPSFCVAGVALHGIHLRFAWQAWVALTSLGWLRWRAWAPLGRRWSRGDTAALCVAGVGDIHLHFAWEAWRLAASGVALHDIHLRFAWQSWRFWHRAGSGGARFGPAGRAVTPWHFAWQAWRLARSTVTLRGTWRHQAWQFTTSTFCVTGVALTALGWLRWRAWAPLVAWSRRGTLRGRRGTWQRPPSLCVAGVALGDIRRVS